MTLYPFFPVQYITHKIGLEIKCHFLLKSQNKTEEKTPHGHVAKIKHR